MWENAVKTARGLALDKKLLNGNVKLNITKAAAGAGRVDLDQLAKQVSLKNRVWDLELGTMGKLEGEVTLPIRLRNTRLTETFTLQQIGIYAEDPEAGEILYILAQITEETGIKIPSGEESPNYMLQWNFALDIPNTDKMKVKVSSAVLLTADQGDMRYAVKGTAGDAISTSPAPIGTTLLWSGTWNSGTITVPGIRNYDFLLVKINPGAKIIGAFNDDKTTIFGVTGHHTTSQNIRTFIFSVSAANVLSFYAGNTTAGLEVVHTTSGSHGGSTAQAVQAIYGIVAPGVQGPAGPAGPANEPNFAAFAAKNTTFPTLSGIASGWTVNVLTCIRQYGRCVITVNASPASDPGTGNIANFNLFTLPAGYRPASTARFVGMDTAATFALDTAGVLSVASITYAWGAGVARGITLDFLLA